MPITGAEQMTKTDDDSSTAAAVPIAPGQAKALSEPMLKALRKAAARERGNYCPVPGVHANAEHMLLLALDRRGFITWDNPEPKFGFNGSSAPRINAAGRSALSRATES